MKIRSDIYRKLGWPVRILFGASVFFVMDEPDMGTWNHFLETAACVTLSLILGLGGLLTILLRVGIVQFVYSDTDKQTFGYKTSKLLAELEQHSGLGSHFSKRYFESYDIEKKDSDDSAA